MLRKTLKLIALVTAMLILVTSLAACSRDDGDTIKIGVLVPLTGANAVYGNDMLNAKKLAVDEINAAGGVLGRKLVLVEADCPDAASATLAAEKLISENVDFVVGGYSSGATTPTLQQFHDAGLMMLISAANSTRITEQNLPHFMINSPGSHGVVTLADLCNYLEVQNAAFIHQGCDYSQNLSDLSSAELAKHGIETVAVEFIAENATDASTIVTNILTSGADFVYWCAYHADGATVIRQLREGGYTGHIAVGDGSADRELITFSGEAGEGVYVIAPPFGEAIFTANYVANFNQEPGNYATLSYDTIFLLKAAIEAADSIETEAVHDALLDIEFEGLSGLSKFTLKREQAVNKFIVLKIENGRFVNVNLD